MEKNDKNKDIKNVDKKKKKYIVIIPIILLLVVVIFVIFNLKNNSNGDENNSNSTYKDTSTSDSISDERLKELIDNSYKYYLLYKGRDDNIDEIGSITIGDKQLYKIKPYNSFEEVDKLIKNTFSEVRVNDYFDVIFEERKFVELDNHLYGDLSNYCDVKEINIDDVTVTEVEGNLFIDAVYTGVTAYFENNTWYLDAPLHFCVDEN